jgi:hypothetical protein
MVAAVLVCKLFGAAVIAGAAVGTHGAIHADEPSDIRKNFVQRCLSSAGSNQSFLEAPTQSRSHPTGELSLYEILRNPALDEPKWFE